MTQTTPFGECPDCKKPLRIRNAQYYCPKCDKDLGEPELTKGQFIANRIRYLIIMMEDAKNPNFSGNYDPQNEIRVTQKEIAEAIDGKI